MESKHPSERAAELKQQLHAQIVTDEKVLRQVSKPISIADAKLLRLPTVLPEMCRRGWAEGAAIAAIQIGVSVQFAFYEFSIPYLKPGLVLGDRIGTVVENGIQRSAKASEDYEYKKFGPTFLLNPYIVQGSAKDLIQVPNEGCLSMPNRRFATWRFNEIKVYNAWDQTEIHATGFMAWMLQHEIDHMHGILCYDRGKVERNEPCPCGQPLKAKKCHLK